MSPENKLARILRNSGPAMSFVSFGRYYYRSRTASFDLESLSLTIFAISECEQLIVE